MSETQVKFLELVRALLDTDEGVSEYQYHLLVVLAEKLKVPTEIWHNTVSSKVDATDGRFYLPTNGGE